MIEEFDPMNDPMVIKAKEREDALKAVEAKKEALANLQVDNNGVPYDADRTAISNMNAVTSIANWKFNQAVGNTFSMLAQDPTRDEQTKAMFGAMAYVFNEVYEGVFKTKLPWKGADNKIHQVEAESIAESLEKAIHELAQVVTK